MIKLKKLKFGIFVCFLLYHFGIFGSNAYVTPSRDNPALDALSTTISSVDITYSISASLVSLTAFVEYIQVVDSPTLFLDYLYISGDHSDILVIDEWNRDLLVSATYNESSGFTNIYYELPVILDIGESYDIALLSSFKPQIDNENFILNSSILWNQNISQYSVSALIDSNLVLRSTSPSPHSTIVENQRLKLSWEMSNIDEFNLEIIYESNPEYLPVLVSPESLDLGVIPKSHQGYITQFTITNLLDVPINVSILNNDPQITVERFIVLLPHAEDQIDVQLDVSETGEFVGSMIFLTNVSLYAYKECSIAFEVVNYTNPFIIVVIILSVFSLILIVASTLLLLDWKRLKEIEKRNTSSSEIYTFD